jgi:hypothetical protein
VAARAGGAVWMAWEAMAAVSAAAGWLRLWPRERAEFFDGPEDALLGGVFGDAQGCADVAHGAVFEEAQGDGLAVGFAESGEGVVEVGFDLGPGGVGLFAFVHEHRVELRGFLFVTDGGAGRF